MIVTLHVHEHNNENVIDNSNMTCIAAMGNLK